MACGRSGLKPIVLLFAGAAVLVAARARGAEGALRDLQPFVDQRLLAPQGGLVPTQRAVRIDRRYMDITRLAWSGENELVFFTHEQTRKWGHLEDTDHIVGRIDLEAERARHAFFIPFETLRGTVQDMRWLGGGRAGVVLNRMLTVTSGPDRSWPKSQVKAYVLDLDERSCVPWPQVQGPHRILALRFVGAQVPPRSKTVRLPARIQVVDGAGAVLAETDFPSDVYPWIECATAVATPERFVGAFMGDRRLLPPESPRGIDGWPLGYGVDQEYEDIYLVRFRGRGPAMQASIVMIAAGHYGEPTPPPTAQWCRYPVLSPSGQYLAYLAYREVQGRTMSARVQELRLWGPHGDVGIDFVCELHGEGVQAPLGRWLPVVPTEQGIRSVLKDEAAEAGSENIMNSKYVYAFSADERKLAFVRGHWLWLADLSKLEEE